MCLSLSFQNYKIVFKVRTSSPLPTLLVDVSIGENPTPGDHESSFEKFNLQVVPVMQTVMD